MRTVLVLEIIESLLYLDLSFQHKTGMQNGEMNINEISM